MSSAPYSVSIVLDRSHGSRLQEVFKVGPVWAVGSPANRHCAEQLWAELPARDHLDGITIFRTAEDRSPEQVLIAEIGTIDEHHGIYSADPPYTVIRVVESALTPEVRQVLERFGFNSFTINGGGATLLDHYPRRWSADQRKYRQSTQNFVYEYVAPVATS